MRSHPPTRAIIGDALRIPILWCQFGTCISYFTDRDALGERDLRHRALAAGWRYDGLGRLACDDCGQRDPAFWGRHQLAPLTPFTTRRSG